MDLVPLSRSRFSTDPAYHIDLLQMLATVVIGMRDPEVADKHEGRAFGIDLVDEIPRLFAGDGQARAFLRGYAQSDGVWGDLAWNPLYGRSDLAPLIFSEGKRREGHHFNIRFSFAWDGTQLRTREELYYAYLESPRAVYHALRLPIWRITEFQTFIATMLSDPERREKFIRSRGLRSQGLVPSDSALMQFGEVKGFLGTITLWNYDLAAADPSRLMSPTHTAWFLNARAVAEAAMSGAEPQPASDVTAWDIDSYAFLSALPIDPDASPATERPGIVQIPSALVDESGLISLLLRQGSRSLGGATTAAGDLRIDRYYQVAVPGPAHSTQAEPLYGAIGTDGRVVCAHRRRVPVECAHDVRELRAAIDSMRPEEEHGLLLYRGQTRHYSLERPTSERELLYGSPEVDELSLQTTASRESYPYDQFFGRFQLFLQGLLYEHVPGAVFERPTENETRRLIRPFDDDWIESTYRKWRTWYGESIWDLVVMGLAQHYGVPTHGLDLTGSLEVALWFALHRYFEHERQGVQRAWYQPVETWTSAERPVIYVLEVDRSLHRHIESAVRDLPLPHPLRVERQEAYLHYGGWGLQSNVCAEDVRGIVFLEPGFSIPPLPSVRHLFPDPVQDLFYEAMLRRRQTPFATSVFERIVDYADPADGDLYEATMMEQFDQARELLEVGAGVHYRDPGAVSDGRSSPGIDVNRGLTALHWASFHGELDLVRRLVERGADIEAADAQGRRPLVCAAMRGEARVVEYLLQRGAGLKAMAYAGWTMIPPPHRPEKVVEILLRHANAQQPAPRDGDYRTADALERKGVGLYHRDQAEHALTAFLGAAEIFDRLRNNSPDDEEMVYRSASAHNNAGSARLLLGQFSAAYDEFLTAAHWFGVLWEQNKSRLEFGNDFAAALNNLGRASSFSCEREKAVSFFQNSIRIREEVNKEHPYLDPPVSALLATAQNLLELYERLGRTEEAEKEAQHVAQLKKLL